MKPQTKRPRQDLILALFAEDPMRYVTRKMVIDEAPDMPEWRADHDIGLMVKDGLLFPFQSGIGVGKRFYASAEARTAGIANIDAERKANEEAKRERRRVADQARDRASRAKPDPGPKHITFSKKADRSGARPMSKQLRDIEPIIPPGLVITQCPNYEDRRFKVEGPIVGGFLSEFYTLRGKKQAA